MPKYNVYCSWSVGCEVVVEAENAEKAVRKVFDAPLPAEGEYIGDSFDVDNNTVEEVPDEND